MASEFSVGDRVRNVAANIVGVVVEIDGNTVYLEQPNGCEADFAAADLVLEDAFQARHDRAVRDDGASREHDAIYETVLGNLYPTIVEKGQAHHLQARRMPGVAPRSWDTLSPLQKLNAIADTTGIPVKSWIEASRPASKPSLAALQLSVLEASGRKG